MNFELSFIPERTEHPRQKGLTMVMDKGLGLTEARALVEASGDYIDLIKLGFGTSSVTPNLKEKISIYQQAGIKVYFGGTLFEAFYARGLFDDYRKVLDKFKVDAVEVSDGSIIIPHDEKCKVINTLAKDRTVLSEVGSKDAGIIIAPNRWIKMMTSELKAGSWKVIAEGRESGTVGVFRPNGQPHTTLVNKIISKVKAENILWEAPQKKQQAWFIKLFGSNVNVGNIAPNEVIALESLRIGLRGDTFFDFLPEDYKTRLKQVDSDVLNEEDL